MNQLNDLTRGIVLLVILAALTAVEFLIAQMANATVILVLIALVKAGLVIWYFMHLPRVLKSEGEHES
jgi:caa(3)-type oxidase subunit IV